MEELRQKARNYFILGLIAERLGMGSESATNLFKALFAIDDAAIFDKTKQTAKDHNERFSMLKSCLQELYLITDRIFSVYRRTYTQELSKEELLLVKKRVMEAFDNAGIPIPGDDEVKNRFKELLKKGKSPD